MDKFNFKEVLKENIEKREESNKSNKEDLNEFVGAFFKPRFGTNLAALKDPPEDAGEEEPEEETTALTVVDPPGSKLPASKNSDKARSTDLAKAKPTKSTSSGIEPLSTYLVKLGKTQWFVTVSKDYDGSNDMIPIGKIEFASGPGGEKTKPPRGPIPRNKFIKKLSEEMIKRINEAIRRMSEKTENTPLITEGLLDKLKNFFATNKKPDNEKLAKIEKLVRTIESGNYRTNLPSNDVEDIFKLARQTLDRDNE